MSPLTLCILIIGIVHKTNAEVCTWSWTTPATGNTVTASVGAPLSVTASVDDTPTSGDVLTWKLTPSGGTAVTMATVTYTTDYAVTDNTLTYTVTQTAGADASTNSVYNIAYPAAGALLADDGKVISLEHAGCDSGSTTFTGVTLDIKYCNLLTYGDLATATVTTNDCGYNCERTFTCNTDSTTTFKSTCQADATWSVPYACDVCPGASASAGVKEVAVLTLVMLCSALSATHLM